MTHDSLNNLRFYWETSTRLGAEALSGTKKAEHLIKKNLREKADYWMRLIGFFVV